MAAKIFSIPWTPSKTVSLTIKRKSDGYYWSGSAWQSDAATVEMTESADLATGYSEYYSTTSPSSACFWWAIDDDSNLASYGEYDPTQTTAATASDIAPETADIKEYLPLTSSDEGDDALIENCANRAGAYIEDYCQRRFSSSSRTYVLDGSGTEKLYLPDYPITAITTIYGPCWDAPRHFTATGGSHTDTELVSSDYYIIGNVGRQDEMKNFILKIGSGGVNCSYFWDAGNSNFEVTATTGYSTLPSDLYQAAVALAVHIYNLGKHGRVGLIAKSTDAGNLSYEVERSIPKVIMDTLDRYRRFTV